jgi:glycosyltransferase involved in cell wall biosynthesis
VPVVAENAWGWTEMIRHGETGLLCDNPPNFSSALVRLANDELFRVSLARNARRAVERLADPQRLGAHWARLFADLGD